MATIIIRDFPDQLLSPIDQAAKATGTRSREGYLRDLLSRMFGPNDSTASGTSLRFAELIADAIKLGKGHMLRPAPSIPSIARALGQADTTFLEAMVRGDVAVPFEIGERVCELFGASRGWLEHGGSAPYGQQPRYHDAGALFRDLAVAGCAFEQIFYVLEDATQGEASIFGKTTAYRYELLVAHIPIHTEVGSGGRSAMRDLALLLAGTVCLKHASAIENIPNLRTPYLPAQGRVLSPVEYRSLLYGQVSPAVHLGVIAQGKHGGTVWFEDFADLEYTGSRSYSESYYAARQLLISEFAAEGLHTNKQLVKHVHDHVLAWRRQAE